MQVAHAGATHVFHLNLIVATRLVQGDGDAKLEAFARFGNKANRLRATSEHDGPHRGSVVLDRKIPVAGRRQREVGDLATQPYPGECRLQHSPYTAIELRDRPNGLSSAA